MDGNDLRKLKDTLEPESPPQLSLHIWLLLLMSEWVRIWIYVTAEHLSQIILWFSPIVVIIIMKEKDVHMKEKMSR